MMSKPVDAFPAGLKLAATLLIATGLLHCVGGLWRGFSAGGDMLVLFGLVYTALGALLYMRLTKIRYLALLIVLIGGTGTFVLLTASPATDWLMRTFFAFDVVIFALLFISIWRGRAISKS